MTNGVRARFPGVTAAARDGVTLADNGAGTQLPQEALEAVTRFLGEQNAHNGSPFRRKIAVRDTIERARAAFAALIGVPAPTVGFALNATSIAFALARSIAHTIRPGDRIVVTDADHYANVVPWAWLARFGATIEHVPVDACGELDEDAYAAALAREPVLVTLPWVSNVTGNLFDVARFSAAAKNAGALVVADGVQAAPHLAIDVPGAVDAVFFSGYKIYAPHFGAWYAEPEFARRFCTVEDPSVPSDAWRSSIETGTQNHEGLAGWLGTDAYLRDAGGGASRAAMERIARYERDVTSFVLGKFAERAGAVTLYGRTAPDRRLPVFTFNVAGEAATSVAEHLEAHGIEAGAGTFSSPRLMRTLAPGASAAVRFSFAHYNDTADVDRCFAALDDALTGASRSWVTLRKGDRDLLP